MPATDQTVNRFSPHLAQFKRSTIHLFLKGVGMTYKVSTSSLIGAKSGNPPDPNYNVMFTIDLVLHLR